MAIPPLDIFIRVHDAAQARAQIASLGTAGAQAGAAIKSGTASAWTPFIAALKQVEAEQKKAADDARALADAQVAAANKAKSAIVGVASAQKQAARDTAQAQKQAADDAVAAAKRASSAYQQAAKDSEQAQKQAASVISAPASSPRGGFNGGVNALATGQALGAAQEVGSTITRVFQGQADKIKVGLEAAETRELQLKTIESLTGSRVQAEKDFALMNDAALKSVFSLEQLSAAGKNLEAAQIFSARNLRAIDNIAAVGKDRGIDPTQTAFALSRLQNADFGEGFQRFRELGINRKDLEEQGLKFSSSNQYQGTAEQAVEGVVKAIEKKFGGLSERLATETASGAISNLEDAQTRYAAAIYGELIPAITFGARVLTTVTTVFADMPEPLRKVWAFGSVLVVGLGLLVGGLLTTAATAGQAVLAFAVLSGSLTVTTADAGAATIGVTGLGTSLKAVLLPAFLDVIAVIASIAIVAALAAAAMWALDKALHAREDAQLRENIKKGDETSVKLLDIENKRRAKKGLPSLTMAQFQPDPNSDENESSDNPQANELKKALADIEKISAQVKSSSTQSVMPALATVSPATMPSASPAFASQADPDSFTGSIRALEDEISAARGKDNAEKRRALQGQLRSLRRQQQDARKAESEQNKEERKAERERKKIERAQLRMEKIDEHDDLDITKAKNSIAAEDKIADLQDELDQAEEDKNSALIRALTYQIEMIRAQEKYADAMAQAAQNDDVHRDKMEEIARLNLQHDTRKAERTATKAFNRSEKSNGGDKRDAAIRAALAPQGNSPISADRANYEAQDAFFFHRNESEGALERAAAVIRAGMKGGFQIGGGISRGAGGLGNNVQGNSSSTRDVSRDVQLQSETTQNARGDYEIRILPPPPIVIPYAGIGALRGRFGR